MTNFNKLMLIGSNVAILKFLFFLSLSSVVTYCGYELDIFGYYYWMFSWSPLDRWNRPQNVNNYSQCIYEPLCWSVVLPAGPIACVTAACVAACILWQYVFYSVKLLLLTAPGWLWHWQLVSLTAPGHYWIREAAPSSLESVWNNLPIMQQQARYCSCKQPPFSPTTLTSLEAADDLLLTVPCRNASYTLPLNVDLY